jgi:hypothetical protein
MRRVVLLDALAGATGLEPATFGVTGRTKANGISARCHLFRARSCRKTAKVATAIRPILGLIAADQPSPLLNGYVAHQAHARSGNVIEPNVAFTAFNPTNVGRMTLGAVRMEKKDQARF